MNLSLVPYTEPSAADKSGDGKYRECLRNHAASMGGQALDGCGEYMAGEGEFLKCAACGCHRNFHRREGSPALNHPLLPVSFFAPPPLPLQQIPQPVSPRREEAPIQKRNRTKFTAEQKEKMRIFAEKLGWRIQKHDDEALEEFCVEIGVNRHVLKVWMHNHKNNLSSSAVSAVAGAAAAPSIRV